MHGQACGIFVKSVITKNEPVCQRSLDFVGFGACQVASFARREGA
jgi:hypothetical protein